MEYFIHQIYKHYRSICQFKQHYYKTEMFIPHLKVCFGKILLSYLYLVVMDLKSIFKDTTESLS